MATIHNEKQEAKRLPRAIVAVAIALCAGASQPAVAQDAKGLNVDVERCVALEKPDERLACFEAQVEAARQRAAAPSASEATGAASVTAPSTAVSTAPARVPSTFASTAPAPEPSTAVSTAPAPEPSAAVSTAPEPAPSSTNAAATAALGAAAAVNAQKSAGEPRSVENFGFPERPPEPSPQRRPERQPVEIVATVTELRLLVPNAYVITLDNGQVWRQQHPMPYPLHTGLVVRVRETSFGYRLTAPELHGQINVERVR